MIRDDRPIRVLYSFPNKLGAGRICYTAWQQVRGIAAAGADVLVFPGVLHRPIPSSNVRVQPTLARGKVRIPYRVLGVRRACFLHDRIVARRLRKLAGKVDIVHTWPLGALETLKAATAMGIPTVLERPNAHTRYAFEAVQKECQRLGVVLPPGYEHSFQPDLLAIEEEEYRQADHLLCASDFALQTFLDQGIPAAKLARHQYGYDEKVYFPSSGPRDPKRGLTMLFVGLCAVRKGLHFALEAWLKSPAHENGMFLIAGEFLPAYEQKLADMLSHPSVRVLGHREDVPELMRKSDLMVLPSIEEGFGLVCTEAFGSGCVPLVSEACTDLCRHMDNALVHRVGDVDALSAHISMLHRDRAVLDRLRSNGLKMAPTVTWDVAGVKVLEVYRSILREKSSEDCRHHRVDAGAALLERSTSR